MNERTNNAGYVKIMFTFGIRTIFLGLGTVYLSSSIECVVTDITRVVQTSLSRYNSGQGVEAIYEGTGEEPKGVSEGNWANIQ